MWVRFGHAQLLMALGRQRTSGELGLRNGSPALQGCWWRIDIETPVLDSDKGLIASFLGGRKGKDGGCLRREQGGRWRVGRVGRAGLSWVGVDGESSQLLIQFSFSCN